MCEMIQCLDPSSISLNDETFTALLESHLPQLKQVELANNSVTEIGLTALDHCRWSALQSLDVSWNGFHALGVCRLVQASGVYVPYIQIQNDQLISGPASFKAKLKRFDLKTLHMGGLLLDADAVCVLAKCSWQLRVLDLSYNCLGEAAIVELAAGTWSELRTLNLCHNLLDANAMAQLVQLDMPLLQQLDLDRNRMCMKSVCHLVNAEWPSLQCLHMRQQRSSNFPDHDRVLSALKDKWPLLTMPSGNEHV